MQAVGASHLGFIGSHECKQAVVAINLSQQWEPSILASSEG